MALCIVWCCLRACLLRKLLEKVVFYHAVDDDEAAAAAAEAEAGVEVEAGQEEPGEPAMREGEGDTDGKDNLEGDGKDKSGG